MVITAAGEAVTIPTMITMAIPCTAEAKWTGTTTGTTCTVAATLEVATMTTMAGEGTNTIVLTKLLFMNDTTY